MQNVVLGEVLVRLDERVVVRPDGDESLTPREADLIAYLLRNPEPVTRDELKVQVWGYHPDVVSRAVHHTVTRLRRKLELDPTEPRFLKTIRGAGYVLHGWTWAETLQTADGPRDPLCAVSILVNLGTLYRDEGLHEDAAICIDAALRLARAQGGRRLPAVRSLDRIDDLTGCFDRCSFRRSGGAREYPPVSRAKGYP